MTVRADPQFGFVEGIGNSVVDESIGECLTFFADELRDGTDILLEIRGKEIRGFF
jgi:hypothetical protein